MARLRFVGAVLKRIPLHAFDLAEADWRGGVQSTPPDMHAAQRPRSSIVIERTLKSFLLAQL